MAYIPPHLRGKVTPNPIVAPPPPEKLPLSAQLSGAYVPPHLRKQTLVECIASQPTPTPTPTPPVVAPKMLGSWQKKMDFVEKSNVIAETESDDAKTDCQANVDGEISPVKSELSATSSCIKRYINRHPLKSSRLPLNRKVHPYYYKYDVDKLHHLDKDYSFRDVEKWAHEDWERYENDIIGEYHLDWFEFDRFKYNWFMQNYGSNYYYLDVLNYDFEKFQKDTSKWLDFISNFSD